MRIVKEAKERRSEILDAAETLFTQKGYNKTTIIDILELVGIAKGTFYYYFKSKEEVMDAIIERIVECDVQAAKEVARDETLTPVQKIFGILKGQQPQGGESKDLLIEQFHSPSNADMHLKSITQSVRRLAPILEQVVRQGIDEKIFRTEYPRETMEFLILAGQNMFDPSMFSWDSVELPTKISAFIYDGDSAGRRKGQLCLHAGVAGGRTRKNKAVNRCFPEET